MYQNYPNPFNSYTTIKYELADPSFVKLAIYDILGREAAKPVNQEKQAGRYTVQFNSDGLSSDVYLYRITINNPDSRTAADHLTRTMKFMLLK